MDMAQQSSLKFKFPAHIIILVVRTTGPKLGRDKLVAIGAAFVKVPNHRTPVQILEKKTFQCEVDPNQPLDSNFMSAEELKQLQGEAKPTAQAVAQVVAFVKECMRQDHDSFIAAHNPVSMLTLAFTMFTLGVCHTVLTLAFSPTALGPAHLGRALSPLTCLYACRWWNLACWNWQRQNTALTSSHCRASQRRPGAEIRGGRP